MSDLRCQDLTIVRNGQTLLSGVTLEIPSHTVVGFLGDTDSGIYPLLRALNRMLELDGPIDVSGQVYYRDQEVYSPRTKPNEIRRMVVTIPTHPQPLPGSIYHHVSAGLRIRGWTRQIAIAERVEWALEAVGLWRQLRSVLSQPAASLSPKLIPRLALATAIAPKPSHILWAEPGTGLDPVESDLLYTAIHRLAGDFTFVIATSQIQHLARLCDLTVFMKDGRVIEVNSTLQILERPKEKETELFITEHF